MARHHGSSPVRNVGDRSLRVGEAIRHALAEVFARGDIRDPDLSDISITVSEVRVTPDLRHAIAFIFPLAAGSDPERTLVALKRCAPYLRGQVSRRVPLKFSPTLSFDLDRSFEQADRIETVLKRPEVARDLSPPDEGDSEGHGD